MKPTTKPPRKTGPKPRTTPRPATKVCDAGHRQGPRWKAGSYCHECWMAQKAIDDAEQARIDREGWAAVLGPPPAELTMRCGDGTVIVHKIPRGMGPARKTRRRRR